MQKFKRLGWEVDGDRVWRRNPNQGPFLLDLDFFLAEKMDSSDNYFLVGKDFEERELFMTRTKDKKWILLYESSGELVFFPTIRSPSTLDFVKNSWDVHGKEHYTYQSSKYISCSEKIEIFCNIETRGKIHGSFFQKSWDHRKGKGCRKCAAIKTDPNASANFLIRAKEIHGDLYDYSQVKYVNRITNVTIICKIHGPFQQKPQVHLQKSKCPACSKLVKRNKSSTEEFIMHSKAVHGDRYDYKFVKYEQAVIPVNILCFEHGKFQQKPTDHLKGSGCQKCHKSSRKDLDEFLESAFKKHGDWYDYSKVSYEKMKDEIEVGCPYLDHGFFKTTATKHISKDWPRGCPKCVWKGNDRESFISMAREIHQDYYNYDKVVYVKMKAFVTVTCPRHGDFQITPSNHCRKFVGCKKCSHGNLTQEEFVAKAEQVHGKGKYNYSCTKYISQTTFVTIRCDKHDRTFTQRPIFHLRGKGCLLCAHDKFAKLDIRNNEWFEKESRKVHGFKYSYDKVEYSRITGKVKITCSSHGDFLQLCYLHLYGSGCPTCSCSKGETTISLILTDKNIKFETQKCFEGCKDKKYLRFDFYIESLNLLIEFDGEQHFVPIEFFGGEERFQDQQRKDAIKNKYAEDNGIELLRIRFDEDIKEKLLPYLG